MKMIMQNDCTVWFTDQQHSFIPFNYPFIYSYIEYLIEILIRGSTAGPVLRPFDIQPCSTRPRALTVRVEVVN